MAKLRHVAMAARDLEASAAFYREAFEMEEVGRIVVGDGGAVYLSDGKINHAIFSMPEEGHPNYSPPGLNHIGFLVEDRDLEMKRLEALGATCVAPPPPEGEEWLGSYEVKFVAPDGVSFDITQDAWPGSR
jgi:catechol 2,3-dioxygenase-like lactoylglutathione lyase family enzyme